MSALIEVIILLLLAGAFCWERGLKARVIGLAGYFDGPPVKKLDVMGVNSSNVILMDAKSGKIIRQSKWRGTDLSGLNDKDYDGNCGIGDIF